MVVVLRDGTPPVLFPSDIREPHLLRFLRRRRLRPGPGRRGPLHGRVLFSSRDIVVASCDIGVSSTSGSWALQSHICGAEARTDMASSVSLVVPQRVFHLVVIQDGAPGSSLRRSMGLRVAYFQVLGRHGLRDAFASSGDRSRTYPGTVRRPIFGSTSIYTGKGSCPLMLLLQGIRLLRCLDNRLILASSLQESLRSRSAVLDLCQSLGIVLNFEKSSLVPSHSFYVLGMRIESQFLRAFPPAGRMAVRLTVAGQFYSIPAPRARL